MVNKGNENSSYVPDFILIPSYCKYRVLTQLSLVITLMNMDKLCLKWDEFNANIRDQFVTLRKDQRLFDVTLATDDGQHIQARQGVISSVIYF